MADTNKPRTPTRAPSTPEAYPANPQQFPSGDYSYTVELVGQIQNQLGKLTEAVDGLKDQSKSHSDKLAAIGRDVYTAKIILGIIGACLVAIVGAAAKHFFDKM